MFEGLSRFTKRLVNKATYDPELDKALLAEKQEQMKERQNFRAELSKAEQIIEKAYLDKQITSIAYTEIKTTIQEDYKWLEANQEATALEIKEKTEKFKNEFSQSIVADKPREYYSNTLALFETTFNLLYAQNKIAESVLTKAKTDIEKENSFLKKNPNENLEVYSARLDAFIEKYNEQKVQLEKDKETASKVQQSAGLITLDAGIQGASKGANVLTAKDLQQSKQRAEVATQNKKVVADSSINIGNVMVNALKYSAYAILGTLAVCYIVYCGSLMANYSIVRPVGIRILFFIFGIFAFIPVAMYFGLWLSAIKRQELFYNSGAYLIPLYEYDPTKEVKTGFERLVWFPTTAALIRAREDYQRGLEKMIS